MITKKDLISFGEFLNGIKGTKSGLSRNQLDKIADFLSTVNPKFNRKRWIGFVNGTNGPSGGRIR